jgi:D-glycero-D-manno-heptose 1,7-bisphosphate phosphatase
MSGASPAVFLDRDGTIIEERHYLRDPAELRLLPGAAGALRRLREAGFRLIIVSNQSGIGRGYFTLADAEGVHARLVAELAKEGVVIDHAYVAPEAPDQPSRGRKPSPQFLFDARDQYGIDLAASYMIGDKLSDLECGWNAGVRAALLVRTGYGAEVERQHPKPTTRAIRVNDLAAAADWILERRNG